MSAQWNENLPTSTATWMQDAECRHEDPNLFFDMTTGRGGEANAATRIASAKEICASCSVRTECLEMALANDEQYGIWGGKTEAERWQIIKARKREKSA